MTKRIDPNHDADAPELTDAQLATARPFREALPELAQRMDKEIRRGRPPLQNPKVAVSIRLDNDLVDKLKENGKGWQTIANRLLRDAVGL
ncbi:MAG: BrnA antitoxin family protein [Planktomarina sp.]